MSKQKRPPIGTVMWDVHENLYYDKAVSVTHWMRLPEPPKEE